MEYVEKYATEKQPKINLIRLWNVQENVLSISEFMSIYRYCFW